MKTICELEDKSIENTEVKVQREVRMKGKKKREEKRREEKRSKEKRSEAKRREEKREAKGKCRTWSKFLLCVNMELQKDRIEKMGQINIQREKAEEFCRHGRNYQMHEI